MARKSGVQPSRAATPPASSRAAAPPPQKVDGSLRPWHLLVLGTALAVAASVVVTRGSSLLNMTFIATAIATVALAAAGVYRTLAPLVSSDAGEQVEMVAGRTRAALLREKMLVLRSIKEVEFDRAMRKISDADYQEMVGRLRQRAVGLFRQLDGRGPGYRELIERELATRVGGPIVAPPPPEPDTRPAQCPSCQAVTESDARFCKSCGAKLTGAA
jgi:hypothetical protein